MKTNTKVKLMSFLGRQSAEQEIHAENDYWKLIGETGVVLGETRNAYGRLLILFDNDLDRFGVANHNAVRNSLWIVPEDLEIVDDND
ncbi:hypothetical protein HYN48_08880 [Flavobacterium magnum]|uniref:Uncharacterized protein n=1 Tax=Flavobacterium magnum TaxID=2162713 RepID=A0A2S0RE16_9FLAO|nr:hypothetical protein [Flavobacterium magnum]AWA30187.1 hypothetical protein HYN48_08880 [Flavobacterium magnum]